MGLAGHGRRVRRGAKGFPSRGHSRARIHRSRGPMKTNSNWTCSSWFSVLAVTTIACSAELADSADQGGTLAQSVTAPPAEVPRSLYQEGITARASALIDPNPSTYLYAPTVMFDETSDHYKMWACGGARARERGMAASVLSTIRRKVRPHPRVRSQRHPGGNGFLPLLQWNGRT
jgi:hypothetical protein